MKNLIQGDCREVLKTFPDNHFHLIVTSPPYNVGIDFGIHKDNMGMDEYIKFTKEWLEECYRVLVEGGRICLNIPLYNFQKRLNMYALYHKILMQIGFLDRDTFVWVKLDGLEFAHTSKLYGDVGPKNPRMKYPSEIILVMQKGKEVLDGSRSDIRYRDFLRWSHNIWFIEPDYRRAHPTPYPDELPYRLIKLYSFIGQRVLDPFSGSGTTLRAAKRSKREGYGIEINPEFIELTKGGQYR